MATFHDNKLSTEYPAGPFLFLQVLDMSPYGVLIILDPHQPAYPCNAESTYLCGADNPLYDYWCHL